MHVDFRLEEVEVIGMMIVGVPPVGVAYRVRHLVDPSPGHQEGLRADVYGVVGLVGPVHGEAEDRVDVLGGSGSARWRWRGRGS